MLQSLVARCFPTLGTQCVSIGSRRLPGLLPLSITDRIAQHQHPIDVVPTPAHACTFETGFDDEFVSAFPHCLSQWASPPLDRPDTACALLV